MKTIHINWYGRFTLDEIKNNHDKVNPKEGLSGNGLYAWTGKRKNQRSPVCLQYIGITTEAFWARFGTKPHPKEHKHVQIKDEDKYVWLGKIQNQDFTKDDLNEAEYILISYCQPPLNDKKLQLPRFSCTVISRFFHKDGETSRKKTPAIISKISEVVIWNYEADPKVVLYTQKLGSYYPTPEEIG
jgi:hypothetical protein